MNRLITFLFPYLEARRQEELQRQIQLAADRERLLAWPIVPKYDGPDLLAMLDEIRHESQGIETTN